MDDYLFKLFKVDKWNKSGALGMAAWVSSFVAPEIFRSALHIHAGLTAFLLLQLAAAGCGFAAGLRGSKAWLLLSLCSVGMVIMAILTAIDFSGLN
jgi:hypothetical protein